MTIATSRARATAERSLVTVETITHIRDIPDADAIVCARVRGWEVVIRRGELNVGDTVLYFEVDTLLDVEDPRFAFLASRGVRTDPDENYGHVLKTARLRGQYSQGLVLPISEFPEVAGAEIGDDVTEALNVVKWDPPIAAELEGLALGPTPSWIHRTVEKRIQNGSAILGVDNGNWVATEKLDGTSMTVYIDGENFGVTSRTIDIIEDPNNPMWAMAKKLGLHDALRGTDHNLSAVVQGELFGPGVAGNPLRVKELSFLAFTVQIDGAELPRSEWPAAFTAIAAPVYSLQFPRSVDEAVAQVDGIRSLVNPERGAEGVVWRNTEKATVEVDGHLMRASWKVISPKYLLKNDR